MSAPRSRTPLLILLALLLVACAPDAPAPPLDIPLWAKVAPEQIAEAETHGVPVAFESELGMRFVLIPAGTFWMGSSEEDFPEYPPHEVTLTRPYYMQVTEVTNAQYRQFEPDHDRGRDEGDPTAGDRTPVVLVTWADATALRHGPARRTHDGPTDSRQRPSGSTRAVPGRRPGTGGETRTQRPRRRSTRSAKDRRIRGVSTTCTGTCGSTARTGTATTARLEFAIRKGRHAE